MSDLLSLTKNRLPFVFKIDRVAYFSLTGSSSWTVPAGVTKAKIRAAGAGGGGGAATTNPGVAGGDTTVTGTGISLTAAGGAGGVAGTDDASGVGHSGCTISGANVVSSIALVGMGSPGGMTGVDAPDRTAPDGRNGGYLEAIVTVAPGATLTTSVGTGGAAGAAGTRAGAAGQNGFIIIEW